MIRFLVLAMLLGIVTGCDDASDLTLPVGQKPDAPIAVAWRNGRTTDLFVAWTKIPQANGYNIYASDDADGVYEKMASVRDTILLISTTESKTTRFFYVTSVADSLESIPSGMIGCLRKLKLSGSEFFLNNFISFPFTPWQRDTQGVPIPHTESWFPQDIFFDQLRPLVGRFGDKLMLTSDSLKEAYLNENGNWEGALSESGLVPWQAYRILSSADTVLNVIICGRVVNGGVASVFIGDTAATSVATTTDYAFRDSRRLPVSRLGLLEAGLVPGGFTTADNLVDMEGGLARFDGLAWQGSLTHIEPGHAYKFLRRSQPGFYYTYNAPE